MGRVFFYFLSTYIQVDRKREMEILHTSKYENMTEIKNQTIEKKSELGKTHTHTRTHTHTHTYTHTHRGRGNGGEVVAAVSTGSSVTYPRV